MREYINSADRRISLDLWEPVPDKADALWPGVWYVKHGDEIDDASWQRLPWRGIAK